MDKVKKIILTILAVLAGIIVIIGIIVGVSLKKYHDENTFVDIEVVTKVRSLDPYEENYYVNTFSDTCVKDSVMVLEPEDYTITIVNVEHNGQVDFKVKARGGLWTNEAEYTPNDIITLHKGETISLNESVTDMEFIIEVKIVDVYQVEV